MGLAENDDLIQALAADRPDQPFGKAITTGGAAPDCKLPLSIRSETG
jgi:hypothetical protein